MRPWLTCRALHFVEVHLDRVARHESALHDNALSVRTSSVVCRRMTAESITGEANHERYRNHGKRRAGVASGSDVSAQRSRQEQAADEVRKEELSSGKWRRDRRYVRHRPIRNQRKNSWPPPLVPCGGDTRRTPNVFAYSLPDGSHRSQSTKRSRHYITKRSEPAARIAMRCRQHGRFALGMA